MFTSPHPNLVVNSDGYSVEVLGRAGLCYTEGNRKMAIDSEILTGPQDIGIYRSSISRWASPHDDELVSAEDITRIVENIRRAFLFVGREIVVI